MTSVATGDFYPVALSPWLHNELILAQQTAQTRARRIWWRKILIIGCTIFALLALSAAMLLGSYLTILFYQPAQAQMHQYNLTQQSGTIPTEPTATAQDKPAITHSDSAVIRVAADLKVPVVAKEKPAEKAAAPAPKVAQPVKKHKQVTGGTNQPVVSKAKDTQAATSKNQPPKARSATQSQKAAGKPEAINQSNKSLMADKSEVKPDQKPQTVKKPVDQAVPKGKKSVSQDAAIVLPPLPEAVPQRQPTPKPPASKVQADDLHRPVGSDIEFTPEPQAKSDIQERPQTDSSANAQAFTIVNVPVDGVVNIQLHGLVRSFAVGEKLPNGTYLLHANAASGEITTSQPEVKNGNVGEPDEGKLLE